MSHATKTGICAIGLLLSGFPASGCQEEAPQQSWTVTKLEELAVFLKPGAARVSTYQPGGSPRIQELQDKIVASWRKRPQWLMSQMENAPDRGPLPYHPNHGLTEDEYREYLELVEELMLIPTEDTILAIQSRASDEVSLDLVGDHPDFDGVTINLKTGAVHTVVGDVDHGELLPADAKLRTLGAWSGFRWHILNGTVESGNAVLMDLNVGRLREDGRPVVHYHVKELTGGEMRRNSRYCFVFVKEE
ncbi:MAG: hypothetical protein JXA69_08115 [Phycisphaerae bacterium]|nr:hypothetical protein [Phycisphaerae bacterium]